MAQHDVDLVIGVFAEAAQGGTAVEMGTLMKDDPFWARNEGRFSPDLEVRFLTPGDQGVRVMEQEFRGVAGLREGWSVWMEPWEEFWVELRESIDGGDGRVLVLGDATARMRDTGTRVPQEVGALCRVEQERITAIGFYLDQGQARRDAGLD
jgi:ketosteroid isomerase-like protein